MTRRTFRGHHHQDVGRPDGQQHLPGDPFPPGETLLIDAANDPEFLVKLVGEHAPKLALIVTTHQQYFDHRQALEAVAGATGAPTAAHQLDAEPPPVAPDRFLPAATPSASATSPST